MTIIPEVSPARKKILMLAPQLGYGGAERHFLRVATFLSARHDVTIALFSMNYGSSHYTSITQKVELPLVLIDRSVPTNLLLRWMYRIHRLRNLKRQHDVSISFLSGPNLVNAIAFGKARTVVTVNGSRKYDPVAGRWRRAIFRYVFDPVIYNTASRIIVVSEGLCNEVFSAGGSWLRKKIQIIRPPVPKDDIKLALQVGVEAEFEGLRTQPLLVSVGRLSIEKGYSHLLKIVALVAQEVPGVKLLLVGDGPLRSDLERQALSQGLAINDYQPGVSSVIFAGFRSDPFRYIELGKLFLFPSLTEGFPNTLIEAMFCGIPILAADSPWGVRSVLWRDPPDTRSAFPTVSACHADYGTLLPRVDDSRFHAIWKDEIVEMLKSQFASVDSVHEDRLARPDLVNVEANWLRVVDEL